VSLHPVQIPNLSRIAAELGQQLSDVLALSFNAQNEVRRFLRTHVSQEVPYPTGYHFGLGISNDAGDTAHDIAVAVGRCRNVADDANVILETAITKQIDAVFAGGTDAGGMFTGSVAADTMYFVFLIEHDDGTVDVGFDTSNDGDNAPANYTAVCYLGVVFTDGSANILNFLRQRNFFRFLTPNEDVIDASVSSTWETGTATAPPNALAQIAVYGDSGVALASVRPIGALDSTTQGDGQMIDSQKSGHGMVLLNDDKQFEYMENGGASNLSIWTIGYWDMRLNG